MRVAFLAGLAIRLAAPWYGHGFRYMDEHWQVMEPAHFLLHGTWSRTTEWELGLRSWIYPALVSMPMRFAERLSLSEPIWIAAFVRSCHGLLSSLAIPLSFAFARALAPGRDRLAAAAAWLVALWPFAIYCGFHTHGEMVAALFVLAGVAAPALASGRERYFLSGAAFGAALALKIDVAVAGLGFGLWQLLHGRWREGAALAIGAAPFVAAVGLADRLAWGSWFHSVAGHARVNLVEGVGNQWGVSPWYAHPLYFFDLTGVAGLAGAVAFVAGGWRLACDGLRATWFMNLFFVAVFAAIPHKEKRFLAPLLYTGIVAGVSSLAVAAPRLAAWARTRPRSARALVAACALALVAHAAANAVTYGVRRPWWDRIRAMREAGRIPGIEKMLSPQWPAVFYLPRHLPAETVDADRASLEAKTHGLRRIGVASDWTDFSVFREIGFDCSPWPAPVPADVSRHSGSPTVAPRAVSCARRAVSESPRPPRS